MLTPTIAAPTPLLVDLGELITATVYYLQVPDFGEASQEVGTTTYPHIVLGQLPDLMEVDRPVAGWPNSRITELMVTYAHTTGTNLDRLRERTRQELSPQGRGRNLPRSQNWLKLLRGSSLMIDQTIKLPSTHQHPVFSVDTFVLYPLNLEGTP